MLVMVGATADHLPTPYVGATYGSQKRLWTDVETGEMYACKRQNATDSKINLLAEANETCGE